MPVLFHQKKVSNYQVFVASDRATAVNKALAAGFSSPGNVSLVVNQSTAWPNIKPYFNDNSLDVESIPVPEYIWDSSVSDGQSRGFALFSSLVTPSSDIQLIVHVTVFTDNAHEAVIEIYKIEAPNPTLFQAISPIPLVDGSMDPITGITEVPPYNWQTVRVFANNSSTLPVGSTYGLLVSFQAVNYIVNPLLSKNPAGLAFCVDIFGVT